MKKHKILNNTKFIIFNNYNFDNSEKNYIYKY